MFTHEPICIGWQEKGLFLQVSVSFVGPRVIRSLNQEHRMVDRITDVLSFPMLDMKNGKLLRNLASADFDQSGQTKVLFLGDIIMNINQAYLQADEYGHSREREVAFLTVHSLFHLLGYDHIEEKDEILMKDKQEQIMGLMRLNR